MNYSNINLAIIGAGKWGFNHVKTACSLLNENQIFVCDKDETSLKKVKEFNKKINIISDFETIINDNRINCVIIATPAEMHYEMTKKNLKAGKNVLTEKPITLLSLETKELMDIALGNNLILMVGHVLLYHPAIIKIKELITNGKVGKLQYIYSNRLNLGKVRSEENILWSFAPHDVSLIQYFTESYPQYIYAHGAKFIQAEIEDTTITYLKYPQNIEAHIFVSWLHPFKEHRLVIIGGKGMLVFEDNVKNDKLKFYKKGFKRVNGKLEKFESEPETISFPDKQPLAEEQKHFFNSVLNNSTPLTDGKHAYEVLKILEEAHKKIKHE